MIGLKSRKPKVHEHTLSCYERTLHELAQGVDVDFFILLLKDQELLENYECCEGMKRAIEDFATMQK